MRTLAKRKQWQGLILFILGAICYSATLILSCLSVSNPSIVKGFSVFIIFLTFIGFCILFTKSITLLANASLLSKGANLISSQDNGAILSSNEKITIHLANRIFLKYK